MKSRLLTSIAFLVFLAACGDDGSSSNPPPETPSKEDSENTVKQDFLLINAVGKTITLGTNSEKAKASERPEMEIAFDYDFSISRTEVTCGAFKTLMKTFRMEVPCQKDSLPVVNVTYYDAVLFSNEKSKVEKKDSAYSYASATYDADGHCTSLEGLKFIPESQGFRLPTEAEWVLVASQNWDPSKGWNLENSMSSTHDVCSAEEESEVCDMTGNVMEWVNDWLGTFKDTTLVDFLGAPDGGSQGERVIKGGSYLNAPDATTLHARGDVYTVTSSTRADYVGFRLAVGAIPNPSWMSSDGKTTESRYVVQVSSADIRRKLGTSRIKLAFRNDVSGNLAYLDNFDGSMSVVEIQDSLEVYHPEISPDGNRVAFSTRYEGVGGKSQLYVRNLDREGSGLVKLDAESAAIPRWYVMPDGDTVIVYVDSTSNNKDGAAFARGNTWRVKFSEGKFGVPEKIFDGAFHGGVSQSGNLAVSGARLLRARVNQKDTLWYGGEQACNVSLSKDGLNRTLFLDFAGKTGKEFVGTDYRTHGRLFMADSSGNLIMSVPSPEGYTFDHSEWVVDETLADSMGGRFAVVSLTNSDGAHGKIALVDLADSSVMELLDGDELWHPCLWKDKSIYAGLNLKLNLDSAAIYFEKPSDPLLSSKMNIFWAHSDSLKVVAVGSSRVSTAFAPSAITYGPAFNMAAIPSDMDVSNYLIEHYVLNYCPNLEVIVLSLDLDLWSETSGVNLQKNTLAFPGYAYDAKHEVWEENDRKEIISISKGLIESNLALSDLQNFMGWFPVPGDMSWTSGGMNPNIFVADSTWSDSTSVYEDALAQLESIIEKSKKKDVLVIGVVFPQSPYYATTGAFGRHGMRRSLAEKLLERISDLDADNANFVVMDENKMGMHLYPDSMAFDFDHLNYLGGMEISAKIDSLIHAVKEARR